MNIEQHGPGGIGGIRFMARATREAPEKKRIYCPEQQLSRMRSFPSALDMIEDPFQLGT